MAQTQHSPNVIENQDSSGDAPWENITNAKNDDVNYARCVLAPGERSNWLISLNYQMNLPANATIIGLEGHYDASSTLAISIQDIANRTFREGIVGNINKSLGSASWLVGFNFLSVGGSDDLWSEEWSANDINNEQWVFALQEQNKGALKTKGRIRYIYEIVNYILGIYMNSTN